YPLYGASYDNDKSLRFFSACGLPLRQYFLVLKKALDRFPFAHNVAAGTVNHDLRGPWPRVVLTGHRERIGTSRHDSEQVALVQFDATVAGQPIAAFTYRPHNVIN